MSTESLILLSNIIAETTGYSQKSKAMYLYDNLKTINVTDQHFKQNKFEVKNKTKNENSY